MPDPTAAFFEGLHGRHEPLLRKVSGTIRFELADETRSERWLVTIAKGDLSVSKANGTADCVIRADRAVFDRLARGRANAMAAVLRGTMRAEGDVGLLVLFQRLLPGPRKRRR